MYTFECLKEKYNLRQLNSMEIGGQIGIYPFRARIDEENLLWVKIDGIPSMDDELYQAELMERLNQEETIEEIGYKKGSFLFRARHDIAGMQEVIEQTIDEITGYMSANGYREPFCKTPIEISAEESSEDPKRLVILDEIKPLATLGAFLGALVGGFILSFTSMISKVMGGIGYVQLFGAAAVAWLPFVGYYTLGKGKISDYGKLLIYGLSFLSFFLGKGFGWTILITKDVKISHAQTFWQVFRRLPTLIFDMYHTIRNPYLTDFIIAFAIFLVILFVIIPKQINFINSDDPNKKMEVYGRPIRRKDIWKNRDRW